MAARIAGELFSMDVAQVRNCAAEDDDDWQTAWVRVSRCGADLAIVNLISQARANGRFRPISVGDERPVSG